MAQPAADREPETARKWKKPRRRLACLPRSVRSGDRFFFFQAEDGIRDYKVTGVQTCALPISRAGSVVGVLAPGASAGASAELLGLADARAAAVVERAAPAVGRLLARGTRTSLMIGAGTAALGAVLFVASSPGAGRAAAFWHPLRAMADARAPVRLAVDRATVRRGDSVTVTLAVPAATRAILWTRGPGEPWRPAPVALDSLGRATRRIGPLESDLDRPA